MTVYYKIAPPNSDIVCDGCNEKTSTISSKNIPLKYIYISKNDLKGDHPYALYCEPCVLSTWPDIEDGSKVVFPPVSERTKKKNEKAAALRASMGF